MGDSAVESMGALLDQLERARDTYDVQIALIKEEGIKPGLGVTADQVLQKIEQWRDELNVALAMWGRGRGSDAEGS